MGVEGFRLSRFVLSSTAKHVQGWGWVALLSPKPPSPKAKSTGIRLDRSPGTSKGRRSY